MAALLIPASFVLLAGIFLCRRGNGIRESILKAALAVFLVIALSTEALSAIRAIAFVPIALLWTIVDLAALLLLAHRLFRRRGLRRLKRKLNLLRRRPPPTRRAVVFATLTAVVVLLTALTAAHQYPYDNDSLCYHLSRVANWINQGHVGFYPTVNERQLFYAPGSEYAVLHVQLLSGTDRYSAWPQYAGMLLCLMLTAMLAGEFGIGRTGQGFTAALSATIPIVIGQSHCHQNELVASAMLLAFAWLLVRFGDRPSWSRAAWSGIALGLALLTKGTAFFYGAAVGVPLGVWALLRAGRRGRPRAALQLAAAVVLALVLNAPFLARCSRDGKSYLNNEFTVELRTTRLGGDILFANALRNGAMHLALPDDEWNARVERRVRGAVGAQASNPESTFRSLPFLLHPRISCFYSPNPLHLALALLSWLLVPLVRCVPWKLLGPYLVATVVAALLFNLCLKWQYWGVRLQLPWLLLMMPVVAAVLFRIRVPGAGRCVLQIGIALAVFLGALPALLFDAELPLWQTRKAPLVFRDADSIRFSAAVARFDGKSDYRHVAAYLRPFDPEEVGLFLPGGNSCQDYNWWVVFGTHARPGRPRLRHVAPYTWPPPASPPPEWIIARNRLPKVLQVMGHRYRPVFQSGTCRVYRRDPPPASHSAIGIRHSAIGNRHSAIGIRNIP